MDIIKSVTNLFVRGKEKDVYSGTDIALAQLFSGRGGHLASNYEAYKKSLYVYACVSKIAEKIAGIDVDIYQITNSKGDTKEITSHPALDLLYKPNSSQTKAEFMESLVINMLLGGEAFIYKVKEGNKIIKLRNVRPDAMEVVTDKEGNVIHFNFMPNGNERVKLETAEVIHIKFFNPFDATRGFSPITPAKHRVETEHFATGMQKDFFERDAQPKAVIKVQGKATKEQKDMLREEFETRFTGRNRESNVAVLEGGMEYERVSLGQKEMDYIESLKFTRDDILVAFKVPKPVIAIVDDVNLANSRTAMQIFLSETIKPLMTRIIEKLNEEMVYLDFDPRLFYSFEDPTPENKEAKLIEYANGLTNGWLLPNEIRQWEGLPPMAGGWTLYKPAGMVAVGGVSQSGKAFEDEALEKHYAAMKEVQNARSSSKSIHGRVFLKEIFVEIDNVKKELHRKTMQQLKEKGVFDKKKEIEGAQKLGTISELSKLKDESSRVQYHKAMNDILDQRSKPYGQAVKSFFEGQAKRVLAKVSSQKSIEKAIDVKKLINKDKEAKLFAEMSFPFIQEFVEKAGKDTLDAMAPQETFVVDSSLAKKISTRVDFLGEAVSATTIDRILNVVQEGIDNGSSINEISDMISMLYDDMSISRADLIARTETTFANNLGLEASYQQSGIATHKEWVATLDDATRDEHLDLNGEVVGLDENFSNGLPYPQEPNCRCVIAPAFKE